MMCDTNWCTFCDSAISPFSESLYCSEECLCQDALLHHPMLGYDYSDLNGFPHPQQQQQQQQQQKTPSFINRKSSISALESSSSLSSSVSSNTGSMFFYQPKPRRMPSSIPFMEQVIMSS